MRKPTAERGVACVCTTLSVTGSTASCPASGSRMMPEKNPDAALFGLPGRTQMVGRRMPTPSRKPLRTVVGEQQFAHRLLRAVGGERRQMEFVGDRRRERCAEHRDRRGEDHLRMIAVAGVADRFEQVLHAVEIDAIALLEIEFGLARHDAGEMEDHIGTLRRSASRRRPAPADRRTRASTLPENPAGVAGRDDVGERQLVDRLAVERAVFRRAAR